jgi:peptidoglycan LD-endopeptidase CwlK
MADRNILDLDPALQPVARETIDQANAALAPSSVEITTTWRSSAAQEAAKAAGLSNAGAGASPHNCCLADGTPASRAFDFSVFNPDGSYVTDGTDPRYRTVGEIGKSLGLGYGGDWTMEKDHCEPDFVISKCWRGARHDAHQACSVMRKAA